MIGIIMLIITILLGGYIIERVSRKPCGCHRGLKTKYLKSTGGISSTRPIDYSHKDIDKNDYLEEQYKDVIEKPVGELKRRKVVRKATFICHKCGEKYDVKYRTDENNLKKK